MKLKSLIQAATTPASKPSLTEGIEDNLRAYFQKTAQTIASINNSAQLAAGYTMIANLHSQLADLIRRGSIMYLSAFWQKEDPSGRMKALTDQLEAKAADLRKKTPVQEDQQSLEEKKEAIATSPSTNITLHFDEDFKQVGESGGPESSFTISMSSTGGKEFFRSIGDREESAKLEQGVKLELRRAVRRFDKHIKLVLQKYKYQSRLG